jgi:hypothetical protein
MLKFFIKNTPIFGENFFFFSPFMSTSFMLYLTIFLLLGEKIYFIENQIMSCSFSLACSLSFSLSSTNYRFRSHRKSNYNSQSLNRKVISQNIVFFRVLFSTFSIFSDGKLIHRLIYCSFINAYGFDVSF